MIKLLNLEKPLQLTDEVIKAKKDKYKLLIEQKKTKPKINTSVWKDGYIVDRLKQMSRNKCCYCECFLDEESKYLEVDHFHPKSLYIDEVIDWENLLPTCKRCNKKKDSHDTKNEPIIHPKHDNPREYLYIYEGHYYEINDYSEEGREYVKIGTRTRKILALNDDAVSIPRNRIKDRALSSLETICDFANVLFEKVICTSEDQSELRNRTISLLNEAQPESAYSATVATCILEHPNYCRLKNILEQLGIWNDDIQALHNTADSISMPSHNSRC